MQQPEKMVQPGSSQGAKEKQQSNKELQEEVGLQQLNCLRHIKKMEVMAELLELQKRHQINKQLDQDVLNRMLEKEWELNKLLRLEQAQLIKKKEQMLKSEQEAKLEYAKVHEEVEVLGKMLQLQEEKAGNIPDSKPKRKANRRRPRP